MPKQRPTIVDLTYVAGKPLPAAPTIFYQCLKCWSILPSIPGDNVYCSCGNISIDVDAGRAGARDEKLMRVLEIQSI